MPLISLLVEDTDNLEDEEEFSIGEPMGDEEEPIDLTDPGVSNDEVLKVFQLMGPNDEVIVVKDGGNINLKDTKTNKEYMIVQESDNEFDELDEMDEFDELEESDEFDELEESDEFDELEESDEFDELEESDEFDELDENTIDEVFNEIFNQDSEEMDEMVGVDYLNPEDGENSETLYELYLDDEESEEMEEDLYESKSFKAKGKGFGSPNKFKYSSKPNQEGGFKTKQKEGPKSIGTGKAKFTYKDGENLDGEFKIKPKKKVEANEASRTLGSGKRWGREGLDKPKAAPRHLRKESVDSEVKLLREKNEEYRNALNVFRDSNRNY